MTTSKSTEQFIRGLQNIERDIIKKLRDSGFNIDASNFVWHRGKDFIPPPSAIELEIKFQGRTANAVLSREQVEDSWDRLDRSDVVVLNRALVADIAKRG